MKLCLKYCTPGLALLLFIIPCATHAGEEASDVLKRLEKKYNSIHDVKVSFQQHVHFGVTEAEQSFSGTLAMKKGNQYRIELEDQTIVTDGKSVWSYVRNNNQVIIDKYREDPNSFSPDKVLVNVPAHFIATLLGKERLGHEETTILKLNPKDPRSNIQWMKIWVDNDESLMRQVQVLDVSDNLTTYIIDRIAMNTGIEESQFHFEPPQAVEIIDLR